MNQCSIRFARKDFDAIHSHLFPGDEDEHGAVLLAGASYRGKQLVLHVREVHLAREGTDYVKGSIGYRALAATFIHRMITRARDERLVYLAVHNHGSDRSVGFSHIDLESHVRGYPALLQIARGMAVGALVFGRRSIQADIWLPDGTRLDLQDAVVVGQTINRLTPAPTPSQGQGLSDDNYDRQVRMFGAAGQRELAQCRVGIIGLGGIGSLISEYLARLGINNFLLVDDDGVERSNLSRIIGATASDATKHVAKVAVAKRVILQANKQAKVTVLREDAAKHSVAKALAACDYLFLAADSMRARLVFNALAHQYLIPGVQLGAKIYPDAKQQLADVMSANRPVRPGQGCLWCNQLIDPHRLALEAKSDAERKAQAYGTEELNPSVISLNAVAASHAVNDFLLDYLGLRAEPPLLHYEHFHFLKRNRTLVEPRRDADCSECSMQGRFARGDALDLPCIEG